MADSDWEVVSQGAPIDSDWEVVSSTPVNDSPFLGNMGKSLMKGVVDTGSFLQDYNPMTGMQGLWGNGSAEKMNAQRVELIGDPTPRNDLERYAGKAVEALPSALSMNPMALLMAGGSGIGAEAARDMGAGTLGQVGGAIAGGGVVGGIRGGIRSLYELLAPKGQAISAGKELLVNAGKDGVKNLEAALKSADTIPGATYAEMANTPSAAAYQVATRQGAIGENKNIIESALTKRNEDIQKGIKALAPDSMQGVPSHVRGAIIQPEAQAVTDKAWEVASKQYETLNTIEAIPAFREKNAVRKEIQKVFENSSFEMEPDTQKVVANFLGGSNEKSFKELQKISSDAGKTIGEIAKTKPKADDIKVLSKIRSSIDEALNRAEKSGKLSPRQVDDLKSAREFYAQTGSVHGAKIVKDLTKIGEFGRGFKLTAESVPGAITKNQENAKNFIRAYGDNKTLVTQARGALADDVFSGPIEGWAKKFKDNKPVFEEIFWKDSSRVEKLMESVESLNNVGALATKASKGQSATHQFTTVADKLFSEGPRLFSKILASKTGAVGATGYGALTGNPLLAAAGFAASQGAKWSEKQIQTIISKAIVDKNLLKDITARATKSRLDSTIRKLAPILATESAVTATKGDKTIDKAIIRAEEKLSESNKPTPSPTPATRLVDAVIAQESGGNKNAVSDKGAQGLMQIMPKTGEELAKKEGVKYNPLDPEQNKLLGTRYLNELLDKYDGDEELALTAYHSGPGRVDRLLEKNKGTTLADIIHDLGPVGQKYASGVLKRIKV